MAKTLRSQNKCKDCGYTWFPRGKNLSRVCPNCGGPNVAVVVNWTPILAVGAIGLYLVFGGKSGNSEAAKEPTVTPTQVEVPAIDASGATSIQTATAETIPPVRLHEDNTEAAPRTRSLEKEAEAKDLVSAFAAPATSAAASQSSAPLPSVAEEIDPSERIYTDEEISVLEEQKQYHGNDPIVRARLGIPSRESRKLIR